MLEQLERTSWELYAVEIDGEYIEEIYDPDGFLLIDEGIRLSIDSGSPAEMKVYYQYGLDSYESHVYHLVLRSSAAQKEFHGSDVSIQYFMPDEDVHGNSFDYWDALLGTEQWPFHLPMKDESWAMLYDDESGILRIERYRAEEETPYYIWYFRGGPWTYGS